MFRDKKRYGQKPNVVVRSKPATFNAPLTKLKGPLVFVCSWSDFFIEEADSPTIDWIISGGESGPNYRPAELDWFRQVRDDCVNNGILYFHKQHGGTKRLMAHGEAVC